MIGLIGVIFANPLLDWLIVLVIIILIVWNASRKGKAGQ